MGAETEAGDGPTVHSLGQLAEREASCRRCPLYKAATRAVPGEGPVGASLLLVGEQPGDSEDRSGRPFVGPAGRVLDRALSDAGIERDKTFVTNAVKHFKHEERGKRRLHKRPNQYEIERCRWWLDQERRIVKPRVTVALGATAARSLTGRTMTISSLRGKPVVLPDGSTAFVTIHPSFLLRLRDQDDKEREYKRFVSDLKLAMAAVASA